MWLVASVVQQKVGPRARRSPVRVPGVGADVEQDRQVANQDGQMKEAVRFQDCRSCSIG